VHDVVAALAILDLCLEGGLLLGVEEAVVVADGSEEGGVGDGGVGGEGGGGLEVLVDLFGGLVEEQDVVGLEFYYDELLACSAHGLDDRIYFVYYSSINSY
jgi:hypothetical protein